MAVCAPADTLALAGVHLDQIRSGPLYRSLPPAWLATLNPFRDARLAWLAYDGKDLLVIAGGPFSTPPSGTVQLAPRLVLAGSSTAVRAASTQYAAHRPAAPRLLAEATPVMHSAIWAVVRGDAHLPLPGNLTNLNRLLHFTDYATAAIQGDSILRVDLTGYCAGSDKAQHLEESVRALVTLSAAATRASSVAALLKSIQVDRDGSIVHVHFEGNPSAPGEFWR